jgi:hypothetical protein
MPRPCRAALIHTCHAAPLPFSDSAVAFLKVRVLAGNIRTASPTVLRIDMLLITILVELRVVAGRTRRLAGRPHAVSGRPMPCPCRAVPWPWEVSFRTALSWHGRKRHGNSLACVNQTWPHYVNQMGKAQSKLLVARHGRGTAWYVWISLYGAINWNVPCLITFHKNINLFAFFQAFSAL